MPMRHKFNFFLTIPAALAAVAAAGPAAAQTFHVQLTGYQEVPAASSPGSGDLRLNLRRSSKEIYYELSYRGLQGNVTQAHIHFGQKGVNGGISMWLCGTATNPGPAGTPVCPAGSEGEVNGTLMPANVVGPANQLIAAGEFEELVEALLAGVTYVNVHSTVLPGGEVRGQIGGEGRGHGQH